MTSSPETNELLPIEPMLPGKPPGLPGDEMAPLWLSRGVHFFRAGLALFLALSCILGLSGCAASSATPWQPATQFFSQEQVKVVLSENSTLPGSPEQIDRVRALPLQNVVALNFNTQELCGLTGCLYALYVQRDRANLPQRVFSGYLNPGLPPGTPLLKQSDQTLNNLPCLTLNQIQGANLKQYSLCFKGQQYEVSNQIDVVVKDKK